MILDIFVIVCLVGVAWWFIDVMRIFSNILLTNKEERKKFKEFLIVTIGMILLFGFIIWAVGIKI